MVELMVDETAHASKTALFSDSMRSAVPVVPWYEAGNVVIVNDEPSSGCRPSVPCTSHTSSYMFSYWHDSPPDLASNHLSPILIIPKLLLLTKKSTVRPLPPLRLPSHPPPSTVGRTTWSLASQHPLASSIPLAFQRARTIRQWPCTARPSSSTAVSPWLPV